MADTVKKLVDFNGTKVIEGWPEHFAACQKIKTVKIFGKVYKRIPYGEEQTDRGADEVPCHDCAAVKGQLHTPNCDQEECPVCGGQAMCCDCEYEGDK